ncbi:MAG TPA: hypothetical protein PLT07_02420 [Trueperaceae bacterium]|nr:hypothetical protein [Trueperaceae bacterium]
MTEGLLEAGHQVTIATDAAALPHPELTELAEEGYDNLSIQGMPTPPGLFAGKRRAMGAVLHELTCRQLLSDWYAALAYYTAFDVVFLPYLDLCTYGLALLGSPFKGTPWAAVAMRPTFHFRATGVEAPIRRGDRVRAFLFRRLLMDPRLLGVLATDPTLGDYISGVDLAPVAPLYEPVPRILSEPGPARERLGLPPVDCKLILLYGAVTERKGIRQLLEAMATKPLLRDVSIVVAGVVADAITSLFKEDWVRQMVAGGRLVVRNRYHNATEERDLIAAADVIWLGYVGHYTSSGVLALAGSGRKPVIACRAGLIGKRTATAQMGITINPNNPTEVRAALLALLSNDELASTLGSNGYSYFAPFTYARAKQSVVTLVERGRPKGGS